MSVPQSVAEVLAKHVVLEVESIDRMYLNVYVPQLQSVEGTLKFIRIHRGHKVASTLMVEPITRRFVSSIEQFAQDNKIPLITFKNDFAKEQRKKFHQREGVVFIGKAQEECTVYRTERRRNPKTKRTYPWIVKSTVMVDQYYFYCIDDDFGPFFLKFCSYFPYNAKLCLNGHEYLKQQLEQKEIAYPALDNGILSCQDPPALQALCDRLAEEKIDALLRKWLRRLPHPFAARDRRAGYRYQLSILQLELSLTQILGRPVAGRIFFEDVIRENLDIDRPKQVQLIFNRWVTPHDTGPLSYPSHHRWSDPFPARRLQRNPDQGPYAPSHHQQYLRLLYQQEPAQLARATAHRLSSQSTTASSPAHQPRLHPRRSLSKNQSSAADSIPTVLGTSLRRSSSTSPLARPPVIPTPPQRVFQPPSAATLRIPFGQNQVASPPGQMTYHLRRLRLHGIIERIPKTHRYRITTPGLRTIWLCTRTYSRILRLGLGTLAFSTYFPTSPLLRWTRSGDHIVD
jgi:hypothetical protein